MRRVDREPNRALDEERVSPGGCMLTGAQRKIFREAILAAFDHNALEQVLSEGSQSRDLKDLVSPTASFDSMTTQLITRSIDEGWTLDLLETLLIARTDNAAFVTSAPN